MAEAIRLLVSVGHPDDESFGVGGTMAKLAAQGWQVTVLCATRGEEGEIADPAMATPETLGAVREQELRSACRVLGVEDVRFLEYRDSGMEGTPENADPRALCNADTDAVAAQIADVIRDVQPNVVITWDPSGGYGHPDHIKVHQCTTLAFERTVAEATRTRTLYYTAHPVNLWSDVERELQAKGTDFGSSQMRERMESLPHLPSTTTIDVAQQVDKKQRALAEHRTQMPSDGFLQQLSPELRHRLVSAEHFHRVEPPWHGGDALESELWTGNEG